MKDMEYSYVYEDKDNKYCYPNSNVLRNKFGITDLRMLHEAEREICGTRYFALEKKGVTGDFSFKHLCAIHKELFKDIYSWAGKVRTVDISKGTIFCLTPYIESQFDDLYAKLRRENFLKDITDKEQMSQRLAYYLGELNMIHPFREGNGRTQRMYIEQLCKNNGRFEIQFAKATKDEMLQASIDTSVCEYDTMTALIFKCLSEK